MLTIDFMGLKELFKDILIKNIFEYGIHTYI